MSVWCEPRFEHKYIVYISRSIYYLYGSKLIIQMFKARVHLPVLMYLALTLPWLSAQDTGSKGRVILLHVYVVL